jgi:hypothetical protein
LRYRVEACGEKGRGLEFFLIPEANCGWMEVLRQTILKASLPLLSLPSTAVNDVEAIDFKVAVQRRSSKLERWVCQAKQYCCCLPWSGAVSSNKELSLKRKCFKLRCLGAWRENYKYQWYFH